MATVAERKIGEKQTVKKRKKLNLWPALFVGPHMLIFIIFFLIPSIFGVYISFTKWDLFSSPEFVGLENYKTILFDAESSFSSQFYNGLENTFIFVLLTVPFCIIVPLLISLALSARPRLNKMFQSLFYLPSLFAISAVMIIWQFIFSVTYGPLANYLNITTNMLDNQPNAWIALVLVTVWWTIGGNMVIYLAALNGVPKDLMEAADLDGAGAFKKFIKVTLPSIKYQILFTLVMTTIAQFNVYGQPLMLTGGGPSDSTHVLLMYIQQNAFGSGMSIAGISSAMAVLLGVCIMVVSAVQFYLLRDRD